MEGKPPDRSELCGALADIARHLGCTPTGSPQALEAANELPRGWRVNPLPGVGSPGSRAPLVEREDSFPRRSYAGSDGVKSFHTLDPVRAVVALLGAAISGGTSGAIFHAAGVGALWGCVPALLVFALLLATSDPDRLGPWPR